MLKEEMNNLIPNPNDYKVNLDIYILGSEKLKTDYGHIPTIEELKEDRKNKVNINFKNFVIYKNLGIL